VDFVIAVATKEYEKVEASEVYGGKMNGMKCDLKLDYVMF
jgi:hypothetical protein